MTVYTETPRNVLRAAIADAETARRNLDDAHSAVDKAYDRVCDAKHRLAALRAGSTGTDLPDGFLIALAAGSETDVAELTRPAATGLAKIDTAEQELAAWRRVHEAAKLAVNDRERHVPILEHKVAEAARDVIRNSDAVARLMDGLDAMQDDVARRRSALQFLTRNGLLPEPQKAAVAHLLRADFDSHADTEWQSALDDLKRDADSVLPGGD